MELITIISAVVLVVCGIVYAVLATAVHSTMIVRINDAVYTFKKKTPYWPTLAGVLIIVLALGALYFSSFDSLNYSR